MSSEEQPVGDEHDPISIESQVSTEESRRQFATQIALNLYSGYGKEIDELLEAAVKVEKYLLNGLDGN